jgi:hypothetical protein
MSEASYPTQIRRPPLELVLRNWPIALSEGSDGSEVAAPARDNFVVSPSHDLLLTGSPPCTR